jgi:RNA polymerase sigma factor (sigma-70 family)
MGTANLEDQVSAAAAGDRDAAEAVLAAVRGEVYRLALRMLGHLADAEDATQEVLVLVLTRLASFRGESAFRTWVYRVAVSHLLRRKRGERETLTFDTLEERLSTGLQSDAPGVPDAEVEVHAREVRLRCTSGMLLCLDRDLRVAWVLGEIVGLSGEEAANVLEIEPAAFRKRLSRARGLLFGFLRRQCGLFDESLPCRCSRQIGPALQRGLFRRGELSLACHPVEPLGREQRLPTGLTPDDVERSAEEVAALHRAAEVLRSHPDYAAPEALTARLRKLIRSDELELLGPGPRQ